MPLKLRLFQFVVHGTGDFPTDMLRYDGAHPATESDSYAMVASDPDPVVRRGGRRVALRAWHEARSWKPTEKRWESFLWKVEPGSLEELPR